MLYILYIYDILIYKYIYIYIYVCVCMCVCIHPTQRVSYNIRILYNLVFEINASFTTELAKSFETYRHKDISMVLVRKID